LVEMRQSARIVRQAIEQMPEGDIKAKVSANFKPKGEVYSRVENSRGEMGVHLVGNGEKKPLRVKMRGGSYNHLQVMPEICKGLMIADLVAVMASMDVIMPEVDR